MIWYIIIYLIGCIISVAILTDLIIDNYGNLKYTRKEYIKLYFTCTLSWIAVLDLIIFYDKYENNGFY